MTDNHGAHPDDSSAEYRENSDPELQHRPDDGCSEPAQNRPAAGHTSRRRRLGLEIDLWRHRLLHPFDSLRTFASRALPYRLRARLLRAMGRGAGTGARSSADREAFFRSAAAPANEAPPPRPTIICLPLIDWFLRVQRPHHLLARLAAGGWPVLYANPDLGVGAEEIAIHPEPVAEAVRTITLPGRKSLTVGEDDLRVDDVALMVRAFAVLRRRERIHQGVVLCHSPLWRPLALRLREEFGWPVVYDRMDLHQGFSTTGASAEEEERLLLEEADLVTASSGVLEKIDGLPNLKALRLPNACDPGHWEGASPSPDLEHIPRPIIGYFGAISEWFDTELVVGLATRRPDWSFVLIGSTWGADTSRLAILPNVHLLGERPYEELPALAAAFDVGIIPRRRTPLTEAMDPVKLYEMMALGLEVVAPPLPEMEAHGDLVRLAEGVEGFLGAIEEVLEAPSGGEAHDRRLAFARANTWDTRAAELERALEKLFPAVTIGIVTFNNRELTELCLDSIERCTVHPSYEIVVVDNASTDGTPAWLEDEAARRPKLRVILNRSNRGFAPACNQAFAGAQGEVFCLLNNDTVVTRGWLSAMVGALMRDPKLGLVGPSSNGVANEARVTPGYRDLAGLPEWAERYVWDHDQESFPIPMLALYCAALRREVWGAVGGLDERFEVGLFEDDDFSRRIRQAGYDIRCLRGAWVHHFQEASFGALPEEEYARIYEANRRRFLAKWKGEDGATSDRSGVTSHNGKPHNA